MKKQVLFPEQEVGKENMTTVSQSSDSQIAKGMGIADLDSVSLEKFRSIVNSRYPKQEFSTLTDEEFLIRLGGAIRNRQSQEFELFVQTILFLGKTNVIHELFSHLHLDYFEFDPSESNHYTFRISDIDYLVEEINLFTFYERVSARLAGAVIECFELEKPVDRKAGVTLTALSEALANCLVHADYQNPLPSIHIEMRPGQFTFKNPGQMQLAESDFWTDGNSVIRNEVLMKLFRAAGWTKWQGRGGSQIFTSAQARGHRLPQIKTSAMETELVFWTKPAEDTAQIQEDNKRIVLNLLQAKAPARFSYGWIQEKTGLSEYRLRRILSELQEEKKIDVTGAGRATTYGLPDKEMELW